MTQNLEGEVIECLCLSRLTSAEKRWLCSIFRRWPLLLKDCGKDLEGSKLLCLSMFIHHCTTPCLSFLNRIFLTASPSIRESSTRSSPPCTRICRSSTRAWGATSPLTPTPSASRTSSETWLTSATSSWWVQSHYYLICLSGVLLSSALCTPQGWRDFMFFFFLSSISFSNVYKSGFPEESLRAGADNILINTSDAFSTARWHRSGLLDSSMIKFRIALTASVTWNVRAQFSF